MKLIHPTNLVNFSMLQTDDTDVYFSYETPIAIVTNHEVLISNNQWKQTTGKHINFVKQLYPEHDQIPHSELLEALHHIQRGNENHDTSHIRENITDEQLLRLVR